MSINIGLYPILDLWTENKLYFIMLQKVLGQRNYVVRFADERLSMEQKMKTTNWGKGSTERKIL